MKAGRPFLAITFLAACASAATTLPLEFDRVAGWEAKPGWLSNPADKPVLKAADGVAQFSIAEPGKAMKWRVGLKRFNAMESGYLVARYRAERVDPGAGYLLWVFDGTKGGHEIVPLRALRHDGQWHVLAVDLWAARVVGGVEALAVTVGAGRQAPASLWLDHIRFAEEMPAGADRYPTKVRKAVDWRLELRDAKVWERQPTWLGNPDQGAAIASADGAVVMTAAAGKGMKWSHRFAEPVDLTAARYVAIRYKAEHVARHGDYFVWIGSETGGMPRQAENLLPLHQVDDDGSWHVHVAPLRDAFKVAEMAIQVQARTPGGRAAIDYIRFTSRPPLLPLADVVPHEKGHRAARLRDASFVDLSGSTNAKVGLKLRAMRLAGWFEGDAVTVGGIPFALQAGERNVVATPLDRIEPVAVPVGKRASEAYLLLAAMLPPEDLSGMHGGRPFHKFSNPERFVVRVRYQDGVEDEQFPVRVQSGRYEVVGGVGVYCLPDLRPVPVKEIALECRMPSGSVMLAGLTLNTGEPATPRPRVPSIPPPAPERALPEMQPKVELWDDGFAIETRTVRAEFGTTDGVTIASLLNKGFEPSGEGQVESASGSFFELGAGDTVLTSDQLTVSGVRREGHGVVMRVDGRPRVPLAGTLRIAGNAAGELLMKLDVTNVSNQVLTPVVNFPAFTRVVLGDVADTWYLYARQGGIVSNASTVQRAPYSGRHPLQVMGLFNPRLRGGLYLLVKDLDNIYKHYVLDKNADGVTCRIEYFPREHQPGERIETAATALCGHTGDWRAQLAAYQRWTRTWHKPMVARKDWFRDIYNYRQHNIRGGLYDFAAKRYRMMEVVAEDREFFGHIDYLHIFDFGASRQYGRVGDYSHYDEIAGREALAAAIAEVEAAGVPVGLYIEGYLCDERSLWGRDHVAKAHIIRHDGKPLLWHGTPTEHMMCPASTLWQDYLAGVYKRVAAELKPNGMYIDQHGFGNEWKICHSRDHGHPVPWPPIRGERELGRKIRLAVPHTIATLTEETPTDVTSQVQDGALGYSVARGDPRLAPHRVDLFRFVFPDFKVFQLVAYNPFIEGGWHRLKFPFFNAEAWWLGNRIPGGFDPAAQAFLRNALRIVHEHRATFRTLSPKPLVPTASPLVYANEFPGKGETVWTLFNADYRTHRGPVLAVKHADGATYRDLWHRADLKPALRDGRAVLAVELGPRGIGCVMRRLP